MAHPIGFRYSPPFLHRVQHRRVAASMLLLFITACGVQRASAPPAPSLPSDEVALYDTEVRFHLESATLRARSTVRFLMDERTATTYSFRLSPALQVHTVQGTGVRGYRTSSHEFRNEFIVELDEAVLPGSVVTLEVNYSGSPSFWESMINEISTDWVQLSMDAGWHPELTHVRLVTGVLRLHLPPNWVVVGSGTTSREDGIHVLRNTIPQPDASFAAGPELEQIGSSAVTVYYREERRGDVPAVFEAAEACGRYLNQRYGLNDPMPHIHLVLSPRSRATFARKNFIPLSSLGNGTQLGVHRFLCHELAHFWATPSAFDPADHWMSEAFAEYVAGMSVREHFGEAAFARWIEGKEERARDHGPVWTPEMTGRGPDPTMYDRAPVLLSRLESQIGRERFEHFVHRYMAERITTTEILLECLAEVAGAQAETWFRRELARGPSEPN